MDFLEDAHRRGVLRSTGPRFEFRNDAVHRFFSDPARLPYVRQEIGKLTTRVIGNLEIRETYRYVGASEADIEQAVGSLATEAILANKPFIADSATYQAALERVRSRLNEFGRRSAFEDLLVVREAPGLGTVIDPSQIVLTRTMDDLARLIDRISSASVGISGTRGIGKSTLIRWLCSQRDAGRQFPTLAVYVTAPVEYDARDFLLHLFSTLCEAVLADDRLTDRRPRWYRPLLNVGFALGLAVTGIGLAYHHAFHQAAKEFWEYDRSRLWSAAAFIALLGSVAVFARVVSSLSRQPGEERRANLQATARNWLHRLRYNEVKTTGQNGSLSGLFGLTIGHSRSRQITENQMTLPQLVENYRQFAQLTVSALQQHARRNGPVAMAQVRLVVGIDEIDRIEDAEKAEKFLNDVKAIFGIPNCFYIASLSADALANFERRVVSTRTAFDTTFDTVMRIGPLDLKAARQALERRAIGLPYTFIALCYVLSGGVPRELMRIARSVYDVRTDIRFGSSAEGNEAAVACAVIAPQVIIREIESLRQGLMPLVAQLKVAGAADLIALLDDPSWPSGEARGDLFRLTKVMSQASLFGDEGGDIGRAAQICDGLIAASYFFFSVDEIFKIQIRRVIADLKVYDANPGCDANIEGSIDLLARARAAIGVNPALAVSRTQIVRKYYALPDVTPLLLSQLSTGVAATPRDPI